MFKVFKITFFILWLFSMIFSLYQNTFWIFFHSGFPISFSSIIYIMIIGVYGWTLIILKRFILD
jgi:hypothetical protein